MNWQNKAINLLTIARKAGKLQLGFDITKEAIINNEAECIIISSDISPKTLKEIDFICGKLKREIPIITLTEFTTVMLGTFFKRQTAVIAVCDSGFAKRLVQLQTEEHIVET